MKFEIIKYEDEFFGEELEIKVDGEIIAYPNDLDEAMSIIGSEAEERGLTDDDYEVEQKVGETMII